MKKENIIYGYGLEIHCETSKQKRLLHKAVEYHNKMFPNFTKDPDDRLLAESYIYIGIATESGLHVKTFKDNTIERLN